MRKLSVLLCLGLIFSGMAMAQTTTDTNVDTVILVSTANYPDAMVASSVSNKLGYPVLLTGKDELSSSTQTSLESINPENVVIIGGPSVVSEDVETEVADMANVTRLWGTTQVGTSVEVAEYFWPEGSDEAVVAQYPLGDDSYHSFMGAVKNNAGERPILVSKEGTLSASTVSAVQDLGATEVEVFSTSAVNVTEDLEAAGATDVEIHEGEREELQEQLRDSTDTQNKSELVIVAASNFRDTISVPNNPNSASYIVSSEAEIDGAVTLASETESNTTIKVVGNPALAQQIADRIENETERDVEQTSGRDPEEVAANQVEMNRNAWERIQQRKIQNWNQNAEEALQTSANRTLQRAENLLGSNSSEEAQQHLEAARTAYDEENYTEARRLAVAAMSAHRIRVHTGLSAEEVMEEIRDEQEDLNEAAMELRETNQEMAEELRDAESRQERLEIISEYRQERRGIVEDMGERMRDRNRQNPSQQGENDTDDDERRQEEETAGDSDARIRFELDENDMRIKSWYTGNTGGYTVNKSVNVEDNTLDAEFTFTPPQEMAAQQITRYESEIKNDLEDGSYEVNVELYADGELVKILQDNVTVPGEVELESEVDSEDDSEDENETENESENGPAVGANLSANTSN